MTAPQIASLLELIRQSIRTMAHRYRAGGLNLALYDRQRPGAARLLDDREKQRIVAMVCRPPPEGQARWTVRLVTEQAVKRKLVPRVGRETIRILLQSHDLNSMKSMDPGWRTCGSFTNGPKIQPNQCFAWMRNPSHSTPRFAPHHLRRRGAKRDARRDSEYSRCGTANIFCAVEPKAGRHFTYSTPNRSAAGVSKVIVDLARQYPTARTIHLVHLV